jgi:transposase
MLYAGIDIHKSVFQVVVLDPDSGELSESRFDPSREQLAAWAEEWQGRLTAVAVESTTGWRWVARELEQRGFEVHLVDPGRASALQGRRRRPKTDRLDARWLAMLLARQLLSECKAWMPSTQIQLLRDHTRLRKSLVQSRTSWAQRLHSLLAHEGWPCARHRLLIPAGRRWVAGLELEPAVRSQVDVMLTVIAALSSSSTSRPRSSRRSISMPSRRASTSGRDRARADRATGVQRGETRTSLIADAMPTRRTLTAKHGRTRLNTAAVRKPGSCSTIASN